EELRLSVSWFFEIRVDRNEVVHLGYLDGMARIVEQGDVGTFRRLPEAFHRLAKPVAVEIELRTAAKESEADLLQRFRNQPGVVRRVAQLLHLLILRHPDNQRDALLGRGGCARECKEPPDGRQPSRRSQKRNLAT